MPGSTQDNETAFMAIVEGRLTKWYWYWNAYMWSHYSLGILGVVCSTLAASNLFVGTRAPQWFSLVSAVCFAIMGFVRPEAKYRNMVRAWTELKAGKEAYLFQTDERQELLRVLRECQKIATEDDMQVPGVTADPKAEQGKRRESAQDVVTDRHPGDTTSGIAATTLDSSKPPEQ